MNLPDIQNHIISKLKNADTLRYRDLKPETAANDLFNYHLKALVQKDIVTKNSASTRMVRLLPRHFYHGVANNVAV